VTLDHDFRIGLSQPSIRTLPTGDFDRERLAGRQRHGLGLSIRHVGGCEIQQRQSREDDPHARIILSAMPQPSREALRAAIRLGLLLVLFVTGTAVAASAQVLPEEPISVLGGRLVLGAEVTATFAPEDPGSSTTPATNSARFVI
jgi:hypothetical protein